MVIKHSMSGLRRSGHQKKITIDKLVIITTIWAISSRTIRLFTEYAAPVPMPAALGKGETFIIKD